MAHRVITVTLPTNNNFQNLFTSIVGTAGVVPVDGIFSDRFIWMSITNTSLTQGIAIGEHLKVGLAATVFDLPTGGVRSWGPFMTSACLKEYAVAGNGATMRIEIETR